MTDDNHAEEAAEIGLLGSNIGSIRSILFTLSEKEYEYTEVETLTVRGHRITVYEYTNEKEDETRYAAEWANRVKIDEVVFSSLIFDEQPDADTVEQAILIEEARREKDR